MNKKVDVEYESTLAKSLIPGHAFFYNGDMCIVLNPTPEGFLVRRVGLNSESFEIEKNIPVQIVRSLRCVDR